MNSKDLRPARDFAMRFGVKALVFGPAGTGKTPIFNTAPRPLLLAVEPGLNSMKNSVIPTYAATNAAQITEFFNWFIGSTETRNFDTLGIDSVSELAMHYLWEGEQKFRDGRAAYGHMADMLMGNMQPDASGKVKEGFLRKLFYMPQKHTYLIAKQAFIEIPGGMSAAIINRAVPAFPGKQLNGENSPNHMYDLIMHLGDKFVPNLPVGVTNPVRAFQTKGSNEILARDRSGMLAEYEFPDLAAIFNKAMS